MIGFDWFFWFVLLPIMIGSDVVLESDGKRIKQYRESGHLKAMWMHLKCHLWPLVIVWSTVQALCGVEPPPALPEGSSGKPKQLTGASSTELVVVDEEKLGNQQ